MVARPVLTPTEAGKAFGVSGKAMRAWARAGYIPYILTPTGRYKFRACDVAALLAGAGLRRAD